MADDQVISSYSTHTKEAIQAVTNIIQVWHSYLK